MRTLIISVSVSIYLIACLYVMFFTIKEKEQLNKEVTSLLQNTDSLRNEINYHKTLIVYTRGVIDSIIHQNIQPPEMMQRLYGLRYETDLNDSTKYDSNGQR